MNYSDNLNRNIVYPTPIRYGLYPYDCLNHFYRPLDSAYNPAFHLSKEYLSYLYNKSLWQPQVSENVFLKRKGGQNRFSILQINALENRFKIHKYLSPEDRKQLAATLNLTDRQVKTWFQNRRAKWRRCHLPNYVEKTAIVQENN